MQQHPIPQQISSYEFRLVGDMTLKQFLKLAGGVLLAYLVFSSHLFILLRLPLALFFLFLGIGMAFFPINEKPLEYWLLAFLKAVYSPTIYIWKRPSSFKQVSSLTTTPQPIAPSQRTPPVSRPPASPQKKTLPKTPPLSKPPQPKPKKTTPITSVSPSPKPTFPSSAPSPTPTSQKTFPSPHLTETTPPQQTASPEFFQNPLPATPTVPNLVNGVVLDEEGKTIEGAIVEIQDAQGNPLRAMRTNALGQFQTATPLPNGKYFVLVEKEPFHFDIIKIEAKGDIIPPLKIQAKKVIN